MTQHRLRNGQVKLRVYIIIITFKVRVALYIYLDNQITGSIALVIIVPLEYNWQHIAYFFCHSDILARVDPLRYLDLLLDFTAMHSVALTSAAGVFDDGTLSFALRTDHLNGHRPLAVVHEAFSSAATTLARSGTRLASAPLARVA